VNFYSQGNWIEAVREFDFVQEHSTSRTLTAETLYWRALAELTGNEFEAAIRSMDVLRIIDPSNMRISELAYHRGRALFYLGHFDNAIIVLKNYIDSIDDNTASSQELEYKAAAYYWIGESLYAMGHLEMARDVFLVVVNSYPDSVKYEASFYRVLLINQKQIEAELLDLLRWSHEESLAIMEEYQRREWAYEQAILSYQRRINDMLSDTRLADLEALNEQYRQQLAFYQERVMELENLLNETEEVDMAEQDINRLRTLRAAAMGLYDELQRNVSALSAGADR
jgi:TolA-binding protein